jgi:hypothetical protein
MRAADVITLIFPKADLAAFPFNLTWTEVDFTQGFLRLSKSKVGPRASNPPRARRCVDTAARIQN